MGWGQGKAEGVGSHCWRLAPADGLHQVVARARPRGGGEWRVADEKKVGEKEEKAEEDKGGKKNVGGDEGREDLDGVN